MDPTLQTGASWHHSQEPPTRPDEPRPSAQLYRRNGKPFACEPCRRGKLRCDHGSPVCGRCVRKKRSASCVYHPAPLTKPRDSAGLSRPLQTSSSRSRPSEQQIGSVSPPSSTVASSHDRSVFGPMSEALPGSTTNDSPLQQHQQSVLPGHDRRASSSVSQTGLEVGMTLREGRVGFLGPTSYSAVFTENAGSLGIEGDEVGEEDAVSLRPVTVQKVQQGAEVLALLRYMPLYTRLNQRWFDLSDGLVVPQPIFRIWVDELWSDFGSLVQDGQPDKLLGLSEMVWRNTARPLKVSGDMTAKEWAMSATGKHLRWEVVGSILSLVGLFAANLSDWDRIFEPIRDHKMDRHTFAERMRKASEYCLCFCYECEVLNDAYISFMYEDLILVECLEGESAYAAWQRTGEVCDAIVAMGIHQGNCVNANTPFWLSQYRRKIFVAAYARDKVYATFLGRPPRLSYRYCKMELPLDLSDAQLFLEGPELEAVIASLDSNGWNTSGNIGRKTWLRVWFQHCKLREEILEIALGSDDDDILGRTQLVRQKLDALHKTYPAFVQITPEEVLKRSNGQAVDGRFGFTNHEGSSTPVNAMFTVHIHVGIKQTEALLERALINRRKTDVKQLIPLCRRMLSLVLLVHTRRDLFRDFHADIIYLLTYHGVPSAGVLAVELLKQEQSNHFNPDIIPRSETIQDLSVFIAALGTVEPNEGNYSICSQGRRALRRVLDLILNPLVAHATRMDGPTGDVTVDGGGGPWDWEFPTGGDKEFLLWLEHGEWERGWGDGISTPTQ